MFWKLTKHIGFVAALLPFVFPPPPSHHIWPCLTHPTTTPHSDHCTHMTVKKTTPAKLRKCQASNTDEQPVKHSQCGQNDTNNDNQEDPDQWANYEEQAMETKGRAGKRGKQGQAKAPAQRWIAMSDNNCHQSGAIFTAIHPHNNFHRKTTQDCNWEEAALKLPPQVQANPICITSPSPRTLPCPTYSRWTLPESRWFSRVHLQSGCIFFGWEHSQIGMHNPPGFNQDSRGTSDEPHRVSVQIAMWILPGLSSRSIHKEFRKRRNNLIWLITKNCSNLESWILGSGINHMINRKSTPSAGLDGRTVGQSKAINFDRVWKASVKDAIEYWTREDYSMEGSWRIHNSSSLGPFWISKQRYTQLV